MSASSDPLVLDNGSSQIRAGWASAEGPSTVTAFAERDLDDFKLGNVGPVGPQGRIVDWEEMEAYWRAVLEEFPWTDAGWMWGHNALCPVEDRARITELAFEDYQLERLALAADGMLVLYSAGQTKGVAMGLGYQTSSCVAYEGSRLVKHAVRSQQFGYVNLLVEMLAESRQIRGIAQAKQVLRHLAYVAPDFDAATAEFESMCRFCGVKSAAHVLPDGTKVELAKELFEVPEMMFRPQSSGPDYDTGLLSLPALVHSTLSAVWCHSARWRHPIVMHGGLSMMRDLAPRLQKELSNLLSHAQSVPNIVAPMEQSNAVWAGGAMICGMSTMAGCWAYRASNCYFGVAGYDELGPKRLASQCFDTFAKC